MKKRYIIIIYLLILILPTMLLGCFNEEKRICGVDYWFVIDIKVNTTNPNEYILYLPIPVNGYATTVVQDEGKPIEQIYSLKIIDGNGTTEIIEENGDYFLKIMSYDSLWLKYDLCKTKEGMPFPFDDLSSNMVFFSSNINSSISIDYFIDYYSKGRKHFTWELRNYIPIIGWQEVEIQRELEHTD